MKGRYLDTNIFNMLRLFFLFLFIFILSGCGQTGPLYLPNGEQSKAAAPKKQITVDNPDNINVARIPKV